jgi:hypothetical protein
VTHTGSIGRIRGVVGVAKTHYSKGQMMVQLRVGILVILCTFTTVAYTRYECAGGTCSQQTSYEVQNEEEEAVQEEYQVQEPATSDEQYPLKPYYYGAPDAPGYFWRWPYRN